jgi:hypothetical protein
VHSQEGFGPNRRSTREDEPGSRLYGGERESLRGENARRAFGVGSVSAGSVSPSRRDQTFEADGVV